MLLLYLKYGREPKEKKGVKEKGKRERKKILRKWDENSKIKKKMERGRGGELIFLYLPNNKILMTLCVMAKF